MEEEKKKPKRQLKYIELRSEEVQELMGNIPPAILRVGISMVLVFVVVLITASCFVKYPEVLTVDAELRNTNSICEVRADIAGKYHVYGEKMSVRRVAEGDTLFGIAVKGKEQIMYSVAPSDGYVYPCGLLQDRGYVRKDSVICLLADTVNGGLTASANIGQDVRNMMRENMSVEANIDGITVQGRIAIIAEYPNPLNNTYAMRIEFEDTPELKGMLFYNRSVAVGIKVDEKTILDKFFAGRMKINRILTTN